MKKSLFSETFKIKVSWEKWHCIPFFADVFPARLKETDGVSCLLPRSICCDITHHVASGKCYCTFMRKWTKQITSPYNHENSVGLVGPRESRSDKAVICRDSHALVWESLGKLFKSPAPAAYHTHSDSSDLGWVPDLRIFYLVWFLGMWWQEILHRSVPLRK